MSGHKVFFFFFLFCKLVHLTRTDSGKRRHGRLLGVFDVSLICILKASGVGGRGRSLP